MRDKLKTIETIEASQSIPEASERLGISSRRLYKWLKDNNLIIIRNKTLKVKENKQ